MASLDSACKAWRVPTTKGYLPHRFLQNLPTLEEAMCRLQATLTWRELEPFMDWFGGASMDELQSRDPAKTYEQWRNEQDVCQWWLQHADETFDFVTLHDEYLARDVD
eukprot:1707225-Pleurochrysis_carterae.AAC.1